MFHRIYFHFRYACSCSGCYCILLNVDHIAHTIPLAPHYYVFAVFCVLRFHFSTIYLHYSAYEVCIGQKRVFNIVSRGGHRTRTYVSKRSFRTYVRKYKLLYICQLCLSHIRFSFLVLFNRARTISMLFCS